MLLHGVLSTAAVYALCMGQRPCYLQLDFHIKLACMLHALVALKQLAQLQHQGLRCSVLGGVRTGTCLLQPTWPASCIFTSVQVPMHCMHR